jgi:hypothetical protein
MDVKQNYVYKGLNLNLKEVKELIEKVYQTEERNRQITVNGLMIAFLDEQVAIKEINLNFNEKVLFKIHLDKVGKVDYNTLKTVN